MTSDEANAGGVTPGADEEQACVHPHLVRILNMGHDVYQCQHCHNFLRTTLTPFKITVTFGKPVVGTPTS